MDRMTAKKLEANVQFLNYLFKQTKGKNGAFTLDSSYGGYKLSRIVSESGAEKDLTYRGTARETYERINGFIQGAELMQKMAVTA